MIHDDRKREPWDGGYSRLFIRLLDGEVRPQNEVLADLLLWGGVLAIGHDEDSDCDAIVAIDKTFLSLGVRPGGI